MLDTDDQLLVGRGGWRTAGGKCQASGGCQLIHHAGDGTGKPWIRYAVDADMEVGSKAKSSAVDGEGCRHGHQEIGEVRSVHWLPQDRWNEDEQGCQCHDDVARLVA